MQRFLLHQSAVSILSLLFAFDKSDALHSAPGSRCKLLTLRDVHSLLDVMLQLFEIHCHHHSRPGYSAAGGGNNISN